ASIYAFPVRDVRLLDEIYELQLEFSDILKETRDAFKPELLPDIIDYLETHVAALLGPNKNNQTEEITEEFNNIQTMKDLFKILQRKYISWFNYELIVKLVDVFLPKNHSLKRTWSDYKEKLTDYFLNSGGLSTDANALEFGITDVPPGAQVMIAKVDCHDYTPADLFFFRRAIPKELNIPNVYLYFSFVRIGSLQLLHNIPDYLYSALFPLTTEIQEQLASIGISELTCGDYKYDLRKFLASQELQQSSLNIAVQAGHTHILEWYSQEYSVDITNHTDNNKYTLAHYAAYKGKLHCLQELINKYQCDVNATTTDTGSTVLHKACEGGYVAVVLYLTSLPQCNLDLVQLLIQQYKLEPININNTGFSVLHVAVQAGHTHILEWYSQEYSVDITNHTDNNKYTLAHYAALKENHQLDLCAVDDEGMAPIHLACSEGRLNLIQYIIEHIPSSLELPTRGQSHTPFLAAIYFNQLEVIKYLISKKCNLSATDDEGFGAVHISVERGHLNVLKYLIDNNYCNPNATDHQDRTPLHLAVAVNQLEILEYLLSKSIPSMSVVWLREIKCFLDSLHDIYNNPHNAVLINVQDKDGNTPLHLACQDGEQNMVSLLQEANLSNNNLLIINKKGQTPLHLAVASGHKDSVEALLSSVTGSSTHHDILTATDNEGSTVFHTACSDGNIDVFHYLSSIYPQGVNVMDNRGRSLLHAACEGGDIGIVRALIETHGLDPLTEDGVGITCLHLLAERKEFLFTFFMDTPVDIYQYLEPNIVSNPVPKDKSGRTPLHYASRSDNIRMVRYLIETFPCTPDDPDNNGYTSVHGACEAGSMELVQYFLTELNCNALAETNDFNTMLYFASKNSNLELVRFLVERYNLKPRQHDIEIARATNPDSSIVRYLEKVNHDMVEEERRRVSKRTTTGAGIEELHSTKRIKLGKDEA
ncbi:PREDICTED: uncharacterized protein LOC109589430, partial [Amphimedon queenslandica]|uniref:Uncharacterized protein n=1 Tax=Amphimedon queenslandica TaxID=400682 RepID=A0AAN0JW01_AMPQE